jgi:hypothetical protein
MAPEDDDDLERIVMARSPQMKAILAALWKTGWGGLSIQALQEFYVTITRKVAKPLAVISLPRSQPFRHGLAR